MKRAILAIGILAAMALPAFAQMMNQTQQERAEYGASNMNHDPGRADSANQAERKRVNGNDPEGIAEDLRLHGHCDKAVPILRQLVEGDGEFAISKFNLGLCLFELAKTNKDAAQAQALNKEGADWVLQAANAGFGKAQSMAVVLYLDGLGVTADPVEAGKWAYVFRDNGSRLVLSLPDIDASVRGRLDSMLTGDRRKEAHARANAWVLTGERTDQ